MNVTMPVNMFEFSSADITLSKSVDVPTLIADIVWLIKSSTIVVNHLYRVGNPIATVTDFFRCPSLDCKTCRGWLTYCAVR